MKTLIYFETSEDTVMLRTYSTHFGRSDRFFLTRKEIENSFSQYVIARDLGSFAELRTLRNYGGRDVLQIDFTWISSVNARGEGKARMERIRIPYALVQPIGVEGKALSLESNSPRIEFHSREKLHQVAENPYIRRQLSKFLRTAFDWKDTTVIKLYDDFSPYSFYFDSECEGNKRGCCGGVIYHKNDDDTGRYSLHA